MPRRNADRVPGPERDVAVRVALERERQGLTAAALARAMTALGCPINQSAINKIEQGDPPRQISVDELVAFAKVFSLEVEDLLLPAHAARDKRLAALYRELEHLHLTVAVTSEVFIKASSEAAQLLRVDDSMSAATATAAVARLDEAVTELGAALAVLGAGVRARLSEPPPSAKPRTATLKFKSDTTTAYEQRAARAAAGVPATAARTPTTPPAKKRRATGK